jgi:hypothetical protein
VTKFFQLVAEHTRNFFTNWREYDGPFATKLALTFRNRFRATLSKAQCCGHPGEPGCCQVEREGPVPGPGEHHGSG